MLKENDVMILHANKGKICFEMFVLNISVCSMFIQIIVFQKRVALKSCSNAHTKYRRTFKCLNHKYGIF